MNATLKSWLIGGSAAVIILAALVGCKSSPGVKPTAKPTSTPPPHGQLFGINQGVAHFPAISLNGKTNVISDSGTALTRDGVPIIGDMIWTNSAGTVTFQGPQTNIILNTGQPSKLTLTNWDGTSGSSGTADGWVFISHLNTTNFTAEPTGLYAELDDDRIVLASPNPIGFTSAGYFASYLTRTNASDPMTLGAGRPNFSDYSVLADQQGEQGNGGAGSAAAFFHNAAVGTVNYGFVSQSDVSFSGLSIGGGIVGNDLGLLVESGSANSPTLPVYTSATLILDSLSTGFPLLIARTNNGTQVSAINFDGSISSGTTNRWQLGGITNSIPHATVNGTDYALGSPITTFANPTATVSGTAVNGTSTNAMRADAAPALANTAVTAGTYGSATQVGTFTVDAQGRLTAAANSTISGVAPGGAAGGFLAGSYPNPVAASNQTITNLTLSGTTTNAALSASRVMLSSATKTETTVSITSALKGDGTQAAATDLSNGTTGSGAVVLANGPVLGTVTSTNTINATNGFLNGSAPTAGHYLRGNGTAYVDGTIATGDLPGSGASTITDGASVGSDTTLTVGSAFRVSNSNNVPHWAGIVLSNTVSASAVPLTINGTNGQTGDLIDGNVGGTLKAALTKDGQILGTGSSSLPAFAMVGATSTGMFKNGNSIQFNSGGTGYAGVWFATAPFGLQVSSSGSFQFASGGVSNGSDTWITRPAAGDIQLGTTTGQGSLQAQTLSVQNASGTDAAGVTFTIAACQSTGLGNGGDIRRRTSPTLQSSGTILNSLVDREYIIAHEKSLTSGSAIAIFTVSPATGKTATIHVRSGVRVNNGTDFQAAGDAFAISIVNKAGTVTSNMSTSTELSNVATSGTITTAWAKSDSGAITTINLTETSTVITPTVNLVNYRIEVDTDDPALSLVFN